MSFQLDMLPEVRLHPEDDTDTRYTPRWFVERRHALRRFTVDAADDPASPTRASAG